ncbi:group III truncated hemoglobin [Lutibacter holmesii]|uniref:Group III truncated hemoglobin n=1 Tax=Lutibacter holmesii TaxID=1137985 RepID=A0ABW3WRL6_9FLAO
MKKDIEGRDDIYALVSLFYKKLLSDELMIHFFEDFKDPDHLEEHLQVLVDFWDNIIFFSGGYRKNAMQPHIEMQKLKPFSGEHFNRWLSSFNESVDALFEGENSRQIKTRALSIATVMKIKVFELNN